MFEVELIFFFLNVAVIFPKELDSEVFFFQGKHEHKRKGNPNYQNKSSESHKIKCKICWLGKTMLIYT